MSTIDVRCEVVGDGWRCRVGVTDAAGTSTHDVRIVADGTLASILPSLLPSADVADVADIDRLVRATFEFLLEREPRASILREFDLRDVSRYFPDYPSAMRMRPPG